MLAWQCWYDFSHTFRWRALAQDRPKLHFCVPTQCFVRPGDPNIAFSHSPSDKPADLGAPPRPPTPAAGRREWSPAMLGALHAFGRACRRDAAKGETLERGQGGGRNREGVGEGSRADARVILSRGIYALPSLHPSQPFERGVTPAMRDNRTPCPDCPWAWPRVVACGTAARRECPPAERAPGAPRPRGE